MSELFTWLWLWVVNGVKIFKMLVKGKLRYALKTLSNCLVILSFNLTKWSPGRTSERLPTLILRDTLIRKFKQSL